MDKEGKEESKLEEFGPSIDWRARSFLTQPQAAPLLESVVTVVVCQACKFAHFIVWEVWALGPGSGSSSCWSRRWLWSPARDTPLLY